MSAATFSQHPDLRGSTAVAGDAATWSALSRSVLQAAALLGFFLQIAIQCTPQNIIAGAIVLASSTVTIQYLFRSGAFLDVPLSALAVLGLCVTTQLGALLAQTFLWTPVIENLRSSYATFAWLCLYQGMALAGLSFFRNLRPLLAVRSAIVDLVMRPLGVSAIPSPGNLWIMGLIGVVATLVSGTATEGAVGNRVLTGISFIIWAPVAIPILHRRHGDAYCKLRVQLVALAAFLVGAGVLGVALNWRTTLFTGLVATVLLNLLAALQDPRPILPGRLRNLVLVAFGASLLSGVFADLATAMLMVRDKRGQVSPLAMVEDTMRTIGDKKAIQAYRASEKKSSRFSLHDESYIDNSLLSRFVETKFHDNMFFLVSNLSAREAKLVEIDTLERALALVPDPILLAFDRHASKQVLASSFGDMLADLRYGKNVGEYKTGSVFANGMAFFGVQVFPLVYLACTLLLFIAWESLSRPQASGIAEVSVLGMMLTWRLFLQGIAGESIVAMLSFPIRTLGQSIVLYVACFHLSRILFRPFVPGASAAIASGPVQR